MTDTDKMVPLGEIPLRDDGLVKAHRDYEDLVLGDYRLPPDGVAVLERKITEWKQGAAQYLERQHEDARLDEDDLPLCNRCDVSLAVAWDGLCASCAATEDIQAMLHPERVFAAAYRDAYGDDPVDGEGSDLD